MMYTTLSSTNPASVLSVLSLLVPPVVVVVVVGVEVVGPPTLVTDPAMYVPPAAAGLLERILTPTLISDYNDY